MKYIAAYMLAVLGGNTSPYADDVKKILGSVGADAADNEKLELLLSQLNGKDITEVIASGREKLASVPSGGAVAGVAPADTGAADIASAEQKKEEKVEEEEEEEEDDGIGDIFGEGGLFGSDD